MNVDELLAERGKTHGSYEDHARCTQAILRVLSAEKNWPTLPDTTKETLHMIAHKMGRIVTGDPEIKDHYDDIAGYARLISQRIERPVEAYPSDDVWSALARGWNCSIEEAKSRANYQIGEKKQKLKPATAAAEPPKGKHYLSDAMNKTLEEELEVDA